MGLMDELKKLTRPYNEEDDDYDYEDEPELDQEPVAEPAPQPQSTRRSAYTAPEPRDTNRRNGPAKVVNLNANIQMEVVMVNPESLEEARDIAMQIKDTVTLITFPLIFFPLFILVSSLLHRLLHLHLIRHKAQKIVRHASVTVFPVLQRPVRDFKILAKLLLVHARLFTQLLQKLPV